MHFLLKTKFNLADKYVMPGPLTLFKLQDNNLAQELIDWCRDPANRARMVTTNNLGKLEHFVIIEETIGVSPSPTAQAAAYWQDRIIETAWPE